MTWDANPTLPGRPLRGDGREDYYCRSEGIRDFLIDVDSATSWASIAEWPVAVKIQPDTTVRMDLINNEAMVPHACNGMGIPTGDKLKDQKEVEFSLSSLVPMILDYEPAQGSEHTFTLKVTDNKNQSLEKAIVFYVE